jgi:hypothetical protein
MAQDTSMVIQVPQEDKVAPPTVWIQIGTRSYEAQAPGLGTSKGYRSEFGSITVYSYTRGITDWQDAVSDTRLETEFQDVIGGMREAERQGYYSNVRVEPVQIVRIANQDFLFVEARLEIRGDILWSGALLTVRSGKLLKYRMTTGPIPVGNPKGVFLGFAEASLAGL